MNNPKTSSRALILLFLVVLSAITGCTKVIPVTGVSVSPSSLIMTVGDNETLSVSFLPENATDQTVSWNSSNPSVVSVINGRLTALSAGTASVTVTSTSGARSAACQVTVNPVWVQSVTVDPSSVELHVGETSQLTCAVYPSDATDQSIIWNSASPSIVTVSNTGLIQALSIGKAAIYATSNGGSPYEDTKASDVYAVCRVTVSPIDVTSVTINTHSVTLKPWQKVQLSATVLPSNATYPDILWNSSSPEIASVDNDGLVKALKSGSAVITATSGDGLQNDTCMITVDSSFAGGNEDVNEGESQPWK